MFENEGLPIDFMSGNEPFSQHAESADLTGDGIDETTMIFSDTNGDGIFDTVEAFSDLTGEGTADFFTVDTDTTYDGVFDTHTAEYHLDTDGDGYIDTVIFSSDTDGDGEFDAVEVYFDQHGSGTFEPVSLDELSLDYIDVDGQLFPADIMDTFPNFNPDVMGIDPDAVTGEPVADMEFWEFQGDTNRCALYSQKFIIEGLTGNEIDIEGFEETAENNGWYYDGTPPEYVNRMLDLYGVENEMSFGNDMSDITECLNSGGKVIVTIDADKLWLENDESEMYSPDGANHALQVIGIDNSDANNPMVILNDSGHPDGCGAMVPAGQFMDAWGAGDYQMVAAY